MENWVNERARLLRSESLGERRCCLTRVANVHSGDMEDQIAYVDQMTIEH
jgi:hypothetical protein